MKRIVKYSFVVGQYKLQKDDEIEIIEKINNNSVKINNAYFFNPQYVDLETLEAMTVPA